MGDRKAVGSMKYQPIRKQKKGFFLRWPKRWTIRGMKEQTQALIGGILLAWMKAHCVCVCVCICVWEDWRGVMGLGVTPLAGPGEPPDTRSVGDLGRKRGGGGGEREKSGV